MIYFMYFNGNYIITLTNTLSKVGNVAKSCIRDSFQVISLNPMRQAEYNVTCLTMFAQIVKVQSQCVGNNT